MIRALVFDLDDTLYSERSFVMSGYRAVARHCSGLCRSPIAEIFSLMAKTFETEGRLHVFPVLLDRYPEASLSIPELIEVYRSHVPGISLCPGYGELLQTLGSDYRLGLITDGMPSVQARKVEVLGLERIMERIIYTWEYGQEKEKPHPLPFSLMLQALQADPGSALFIGDNPRKDCCGAHAAGMRFVQVLHPAGPRLGKEEKPEYLIENLFELPQILRLLN